MTLHRLSIGKLMVVVFVVAINLAVGRSLFAAGFEMGAGVAPMGCVLQLVLLRMVCGKSPGRTFWAGFLVFGAIAFASLVLALSYPSRMVTVIDSRARPIMEWRAGGSMARLWDRYGDLIGAFVENFPALSRALEHSHEAIVWIVMGVIWLLPELCFASFGGLSVSLVARSLARRRAGSRAATGISGEAGE